VRKLDRATGSGAILRRTVGNGLRTAGGSGPAELREEHGDVIRESVRAVAQEPMEAEVSELPAWRMGVPFSRTGGAWRCHSRGRCLVLWV